MLLATNSTSPGTWIALATLIVLMIPVYIMSLRGAQSYGRLEQKVDSLALAQLQTATAHSEAMKIMADTMSRLTDKFNEHAIQDAGHFGELRGLYTGTNLVPPAPKASTAP